MDAGVPSAPDLPPGRVVDLGERGTTFVRELAGPPGAPTVVLLHGWTASADLNWFPSYEPLARRFRVVALDHRGHGRGIRARNPFRLQDCADDVAALADALGIERFLAVGYSMGGPIAKLAWRRHPDRVDGLVLCATAGRFTSGRAEERLRFQALASLALASRHGPDVTRRWLSEQFVARKGREYEPWAFEQVRRHDVTALLEAGREIGRFSSVSWTPEIDVPTAVVVSTNDRLVPPHRQARLAESIPGAKVFPVAIDHDGCVYEATRFVPTLVAATTWVAEQSRLAGDRRTTRSA